MISEQDKQAILNGAYAITRNGRKAKYVGTYASKDYRHYFIFLDENNEILHSTGLTKDLKEYIDSTSQLDVIGLWQDKPEPFDLDRALAGEPINHGGRKCFICKNPLPDSNKDYIVSGQYSLFLTDLSFLQICKMWKEPQPEPNTVTLTLPCPLKEPTGYKWYVNSELDTPRRTNTDIYVKTFISEGCYFDTKEDAQAWLDAMRNNRR